MQFLSWSQFVTQLFEWCCLRATTYIYYTFLMAQVTVVILLLIKIIDDTFWGKKITCPFSEIYFSWGKLVIVFLHIWLTETDVLDLRFFWLVNTGCLPVILSWTKINIPDIIIFHIWMRTCMPENIFQGFFSIDKNGEASYKFGSVLKK